MLRAYLLSYAQVAALLDIKKWKVAQYHKAAMKALRAQSQLAELAHAV